MTEIISDDIGSFPLPEEDREKIRKIAADIVNKKAGEEDTRYFKSQIADIMQQKIEAGIMRPSYPQIQDMISGFTRPMEEHSEKNKPYLIKNEYAVIPELLAVESTAEKYFKENRRPLPIRVVVTGPLELYLSAAGKNIQADLLNNFAVSVNRFLKNALTEKKYLKPSVVCIDEPSLGLNPNLAVEDDILIDAWDKTTEGIKIKDIEVHLHSTNGFDKICQTKKINVVGIEYAATPKSLDLIDKHELESYDRFLRVGVAKTNILQLAAEYSELTGVDVWKTKDFEDMVERLENKKNIAKRISKAYSRFGERIKYMGPDCGLGSWPSQKAAKKLLTNTAEAVDEHNKTK